MTREPFPLPPAPAPASLSMNESYYEDPQPYDPISNNDDNEQVSSSYESYDEEEISKGKSTAQHQWPSQEASIELMKDARICAFLWRKKWLGQWAKQLCVIREHRLLCYKSSKDQTPLLDISLQGCSVIYKEKQTKRKEHKLKISPLGGEAIVLGLQSKEQAEQWLKVIQEISPKNLMGSDATDSPTLICTKGEQSERYSVVSESGSSTDSHPENLDSKDGNQGKKKYKFSNLMNIGKKKVSSLESPEKNVDTSGYLNVLVNTQWRSRWCSVKNRQLWIYNDKSRSKVSTQPLSLEGCLVLPDPSPEHLYSFRIQMDGEELATLEAKSSTDMGHWLGLILSQTGTKTDPEDLPYDYVNSERISSIVNAARTSMYLMQRRFSEPNTYTDNPPSGPENCDDLYDDVPSTENEQEEVQEVQNDGKEGTENIQENGNPVYLDLIPLRSFLHTNSGRVSPQTTELSSSSINHDEQQNPEEPEYETSISTMKESQELRPPLPLPRVDIDPSTVPNLNSLPQRISFQDEEIQKNTTPTTQLPQIQTAPQASAPMPQSPPACRIRAASTDKVIERLKFSPAGSVEVKLGKNRTEADVRRYTDERDRLEREREEVKNTLATLRKDRRDVKEELSNCQESAQQASMEARLKQMEEMCREAERRRVEVELHLMEVKENLRKVEAGPFTLGTTVDSSLLEISTPKVAPMSMPAPNPPINNTGNGDSPINCATALKNRPVSIMAPSKGNVLQKAKEWEKKSTT